MAYGGCSGGGYGTAPYAGSSYSGTPYAAPYSGGYYQGGYYGPPAGTTGRPYQPGAPQLPESRTPAPKSKISSPPEGIEDETIRSDLVKGQAPALLVVTLPAEATLAIDGNPTKATTSVREFTSPPLQPGQDYHYTLTARITRAGQPLTVTQRVAVRAGQTTPVAMIFPTADATASR
jgi:uncharacterized protein (TIGR03000 family)